MAHDVFISYSSKDKAVADAVCATIENRKIRCWIAPRDVPPGLPYAAALVNAINDSKVFVLVLSKRSNSSGAVMREVEEAVDSGIPIIPLRIEDIEPTAAMRYYIKSLHWIDAMSPPLEKHLGKLADSVEAILSVGEEEQQPPFPVVETMLEAPAKKRWPLPTWATALLALAAVVIVGGGIWAISQLGSATGETSPTEVASPTEVTSPTEVGSLPFRDDFDNALAEGWNIVREVSTHWSLTDNPGSWRITLQAGAIGDAIPQPPSNLLLREAPNGDFEIATLIHFTPVSNVQFAGLIVYQDELNAVQFGRAYCDLSETCVGNGIYFDNTSDISKNYATVTSNPSIAYLRLSREGTTYTGYYSEDGGSWTTIGQHTSNITPLRVGLTAGQVREAETIADFEYFTMDTALSPSPSWSEWRTLSFDFPHESFWRQSEDGSYTAIEQHQKNTFAWSEEIIEGDLVLTFDVTSSYEDSEALIFVYGNGIGYAYGDLIFAVDAADNVFKIERDLGSSIDHGGENWLAIYDAVVDLDFMRRTYSLKIEIIDDEASMYVDGVKVVSAFIPSEISRQGRIGLAKFWQAHEITYSNIKIKTFNNGE